MNPWQAIHPTDVIRFTLRLRALRVRRRLEQAQRAARAGVSRSVIDGIGCGRADQVAIHTAGGAISVDGRAISSQGHLPAVVATSPRLARGEIIQAEFELAKRALGG